MVYRYFSTIWNYLILSSVSHIVTTDVIPINLGIYSMFWGPYTLNFAASFSIFILRGPEYSHLSEFWLIVQYDGGFPSNISDKMPLRHTYIYLRMLNVITCLKSSTGTSDGVIVFWRFCSINQHATLSRNVFTVGLDPCRHHFWLSRPVIMRLGTLLCLPLVPDIIPSVWNWP